MGEVFFSLTVAAAMRRLQNDRAEAEASRQHAEMDRRIVEYRLAEIRASHERHLAIGD